MEENKDNLNLNDHKPNLIFNIIIKTTYLSCYIKQYFNFFKKDFIKKKKEGIKREKTKTKVKQDILFLFSFWERQYVLFI